MRTTQLWSILAIGIGCATAMAQTSEPPGQENLNITQIMGAMGGGISLPGAEEASLPKFEDVTKGMEKSEGLFTLWSYPKGAADKDQEKLLCQIPASFLGENFMLSTSFSGGGFFTGFPLDQRVVKWQLLDKQLILVEPEAGYVVDSSKDVSDAVRRTYPEAIRVAIDLVTKAPNGDPVIDFGRLLKSEFADIGWMTGSIGPFGTFSGGGNINSALSTWTKKKSFPLNVEIGVDLAVSNAYPPGSYDKKMVHYSFWKLQNSDYQPRVADDRVGYFLTTNQDWSKPADSRDVFNRYVDRWHLVKRDPSLELCEPKNPIVFYIEKTVPIKYRRAVRDGILEWNKAYEKVGFLNAIEVKQQTEDDEFTKHLDPEDMRYSFFRWIVTGAGFAMGPHRANPFTGQIYDADIIFDDSMVRYFEQSAKINLPSALATAKYADPALAAFLGKNPEWRRPTRDWENVDLTNPEMDAVRQRMRQRLGPNAMHCCQYADGMKHELAFGHAMLAGQPQEVIDELLYQVIKEVVMHEVGHTLGLRHNFKASSVWTVDEIKQRRKEGLATVGSVMDYNPVLFFAEGATDGDFITPTIGPYDYWAIEYGYRTSAAPEEQPAKADDGEKNEEASEPAEKSEQAAVFKAGEAQMSSGSAIDLDSIPPEIRSQLPPEVLEMIKSGKAQAMMQSAAAGMGAVPPAGGGGSGPSFASAPSGEEAMLHKIASRASERELAYATDEDTTYLAPDPRVNRFDMAADSIAWAKARAELIDKRLENILEWAVKDQESWYHLRSAFASLTFDKARQVNYVGRFIGGQYFNRDHRGDKDARAPFEVVDVNQQREAMAFIEETIFQDSYFNVPAEVLNHLSPSRWWHEGTSINLTMDFPVHDMIAALQWNVLFDRLFPNTLRRIHDAEFKADGSDKFTAAEYIKRLAAACWADTANEKRIGSKAWSNNEPFVSDVRRSLQREYLGLLEPLVRRAPGEVISPDLHAMISYSLQTLSEELGSVIATGKADFASQAHLVTCKSRIDRMLAPELDEIRPEPTFMMFGQPTGQSK